MLQITNIQHLNFQRNGICGRPFYSCFVNVSDTPNYLLVSFETKNSITVDVESCRVIDPFHPLESWRGDDIGEALQNRFKEDLLQKEDFLAICDLISKYTE